MAMAAGVATAHCPPAEAKRARKPMAAAPLADEAAACREEEKGHNGAPSMAGVSCSVSGDPYGHCSGAFGSRCRQVLDEMPTR